jgi:hypothetical protein
MPISAPKPGTPKSGTTSSKVPQAVKTVSKPAVAAAKVPVLGTKTPSTAVAPVAPRQVNVQLPAITPSLIVQLFENIPEYRLYKIVNLDMLIQGMMHLATAPLNGIGPGGLAVVSSPLNNFLAQLIQMAVEKGSKGVQQNR